jgi:hypothetical protein
LSRRENTRQVGNTALFYASNECTHVGPAEADYDRDDASQQVTTAFAIATTFPPGLVEEV